MNPNAAPRVEPLLAEAVQVALLFAEAFDGRL